MIGFLQRWRVSRTRDPAMLIAATVILSFGTMLANQVNQLATELPRYQTIGTRRLAGACHPTVDLAAKRNKIDGLGQERLGTAFQGFSPGTVVAVGGDHDDGDVRSCCLGLRQ